MKNVLLYLVIALTLFSQKQTIKVDQPPNIDGALEELWNTGAKINTFKQFSPVIKDAERYKTSIHILYDDDFLYLGARVWQPKSELISNRYRRDSFETWKGDFLQLMFSTGESSVNAYFITINPSNSKLDGIFNEQTEESLNLDLNSVSETTVFDDRWELEVKIPLSDLEYQNATHWMFSIIRHVAFHSEKSTSHNFKHDNIFEINSFEPIFGFEDLGKNSRVTATAYQQYQYQKDHIDETTYENGNRGYDINYQPTGSSRLLVTINPDFAQLESDEPIINVGDEPTNYPEKRAFFTQSSDMYKDHSTVRTRNISSIDLGIKWIHEIENIKYDITAIQDKRNNRWLLSDIIYTNDKSYRYEIVNGLKNDKVNTFHTSRLNIDRYFFDKRLKFVNQSEYTKNEKDGYGNKLQAIYQTRNWLLAYENQIKNDTYDTGEIGYKETSNKFNNKLQMRYSKYFRSSWLLFVKPEINIEDYGLYSGSSQRSRMFDMKIHSLFNLGETFGVWYFGARYQPEISQSFRYRHSAGANSDNYSNFDIKQSSSDTFVSWVGSDKSKIVSLEFEFGNSSVRAAHSDFQTLTLFFNLHQNIGLSYKLDRINIAQSNYQTKLTAITHRLKLDYNITDKMNLRTIYNFSEEQLPLLPINNHLTGLEQQTPNFNMTFSWEYSVGSYIYFMYNDFTNKEKISNFEYETIGDNHSFVLKINKSFNL